MANDKRKCRFLEYTIFFWNFPLLYSTKDDSMLLCRHSRGITLAEKRSHLLQAWEIKKEGSKGIKGQDYAP